MSVQAKVVGLNGVAKAIAADGTVRVLSVGDTLRAGERVELSADAALTL